MCWGKVIQGGLVRYVLCAGGRSYRVVWLGMYCVQGEVIQGGLVRYVLCAGGRSYRVVWLGMYCVLGEGHTGWFG